MRVTLWGTRGSLATPGPETAGFGGNTSCVEVMGTEGTLLVLDAGTGIRSLGALIPPSTQRVDLFLTHLHMDHIQGLGFFAPLFDPAMDVHIWGPASTTLTLRERLARYLSPPLFPLTLHDVECNLVLHEVPSPPIRVGEFTIASSLVCHPNPTAGYRISGSGATVTYLPDHEPALGLRHGYLAKEWTSGYSLSAGADLLIHDAQYTDDEYINHVGWGHSSMGQAIAFAALAGVRHLVAFHHDPSHDDQALDNHLATAIAAHQPSFTVTPAREGAIFDIGR
ncbi:MAG: MBL fold metallo-hydrolase [Chloroflexota bacterium]